MKQQLRYVNFYKRSLERGCLHGFAVGEDLTLWMRDAVEPCACITPMFDTGDPDMTYNRLAVEGDFEGVKLEVIVAVADVLDQVIDDKPVTLDAYFADPHVDLRRKAEVMQALRHVRVVNTQDLLLHSLGGRYVWVFVAAYPGESDGCTLTGMRLEFPKNTFTDYFPEIYRGNDFFDRFISVFQSMYLDIERRIDEVPAMLDYESTSAKNVATLAGWLGIDNSRKLFNTDQLRHMIENIDLFQGAKGTRPALEEVIHLACGIRPQIVEHFQWSNMPLPAAHRKLCGELYGDTQNHFCVILNALDRKNAMPIGQEDLEYLIEQYSMIGTQHKLVYLRRCSHTDTYNYLDINSFLSTPETAAVDGVMLGGHVTVG